MSIERRQGSSGHGVKIVTTECRYCGADLPEKHSYATHIPNCPVLGTAYGGGAGE